uniref:Lysophosphatidylcholine acyltransferase 3 n=1 Tax=Pongo abelii TaxID=9601 RepID=A0A8I5UB67_PONAB
MASSAEGDEGTVVALAGVLQSGFQELSLNKLATSLGASEQALRLIISIFLATYLSFTLEYHFNAGLGKQ